VDARRLRDILLEEIMLSTSILDVTDCNLKIACWDDHDNSRIRRVIDNVELRAEGLGRMDSGFSAPNSADAFQPPDFLVDAREVCKPQ
jgi:hypothetical protein